MESKIGSLSSWRSRLYASGRPLRVASSPVRLPISRPALPRASSATSGFFFCGMMLDPVDHASAKRGESELLGDPDDHVLTQPGEVDARSGRRRTRPPPPRSRADVPSIELATLLVNPSSLATASGSRPREVPARAAEPYGLTAEPSVKITYPIAVPQQRPGVGEQMVGEQHRLRMLQVGTTRHRNPEVSRACWCSAPTTLPSPAATVRRASRRYILIKVAIWSLRDRPARSRPPSSAPTSSTSRRSSAPCTSSSVWAGGKAPEATSDCQGVEAVDHPRELVIGQQTGLVERPGVRP